MHSILKPIQGFKIVTDVVPNATNISSLTPKTVNFSVKINNGYFLAHYSMSS